MNNLGDILKKVILYNIKAYKYLLTYYENYAPKDKQNTLNAEVARHGFQQNYYLYKELDDVTFIADNEPTAEFEEAMSLGFAEATGVEEPKRDKGKEADLAELERMMKIGEENKTNGEPTINYGDWYNRLLGPGSGEGKG